MAMAVNFVVHKEDENLRPVDTAHAHGTFASTILLRKAQQLCSANGTEFFQLIEHKCNTQQR